MTVVVYSQLARLVLGGGQLAAAVDQRTRQPSHAGDPVALLRCLVAVDVTCGDVCADDLAEHQRLGTRQRQDGMLGGCRRSQQIVDRHERAQGEHGVGVLHADVCQLLAPPCERVAHGIDVEAAGDGVAQDGPTVGSDPVAAIDESAHTHTSMIGIPAIERYGRWS